MFFRFSHRTPSVSQRAIVDASAGISYFQKTRLQRGAKIALGKMRRDEEKLAAANAAVEAASVADSAELGLDALTANLAGMGINDPVAVDAEDDAELGDLLAELMPAIRDLLAQRMRTDRR